MVQFEFIDMQSLFLDSFRLGRKIYESGFIPTHAISLWRGGTPIGLGVGEYFRLKGHFINHTTIATASYTGINSKSEVIIKGLEHLIKVIAKEDKLLIIDDIYDSGNTIEAIIQAIHKSARANAPEKILVACVHNKLKKRNFNHRLIALKDVHEDIWVNYAHEISDLIMDDDPGESFLKQKSGKIYSIISQKESFPVQSVNIAADYHYIDANQLMEDSLKLAVNIVQQGFFPDFIVAIWPGGVNAGLPIHEYYKYTIIKNKLKNKIPDHISINTSLSHYSYKSNIIGTKYLEDNINAGDKILLIDTIFSSGRLMNQTIEKLKNTLRRNLTVNNIHLASVYYYPKNDFTSTATMYYEQPHYYYKKTNCQIVFPHQIHRLVNPERELDKISPQLKKIIYGG